MYGTALKGNQTPKLQPPEKISAQTWHTAQARI